MAERNQIKVRLCKHCGEGIVGKATKLMAHYETHKDELKLAAETAIMDKIKADMMRGEIETAS